MPRVVLLHGFTQTSVSWRPVVERLGPDVDVVAPDLPGHGTAGAVRLDLAGTAARVADVGGPATYVGYSMGGRVALRLALDRPDLVTGLVLVGATAGIDDAAERAARREADEALARRIEADGVEPFLERWLAQPLFAGLTPASDDLAARRANTAEGLAASLRLSGTGTMDPPWWDELGRVDAPTTIVVGERDAKFRTLGRRLAAGIGPTARLVVVAGAGHACHLEVPGSVAAVISPGT
ncbi:alpha/beta fold hydrolase [Iamia sp. SCSIO 61187]|uniref:alpha/beta fold hydrolase n=1 Tax=Iamia sp. SCSIO 61187 TaxID=2722752 RepID=UPI001C630CF1|nr:alpha/beta fold hydrolase [Iamia sp. SCSIO 61187]QYG93375.1 alpha/beta fold hydrolase [Iamia sp. SCSIO 61187]